MKMQSNNTNEVNWAFCQSNSDLILACGLKSILSSSLIDSINEIQSSHGNYLISYKEIHYYIGEAKDLKKRIRQQYDEKNSTFYNNYVDSRKHYEVGKIPILDFELEIIYTKIGRKEIEEFGMVNLPTKLNKFERGKRRIVKIDIEKNIWNDVQAEFEKLLIEGEEEFFKKPINAWNSAFPKTLPGVYMVVNSTDDIIYIGESSDISERYSTHGSSTYFSALRRHIGTELLGLKFIDSKKRKFNDFEDHKVTNYLRECKYRSMLVSFGRFELEEYLIRKYSPLLNRKGNE
jgi:predicted GIY-YIG superfamily endonuclease